MATKGKDKERKFILECIKVYRSLPALWNINSKDYSNRIKKSEQYEQLLRKYREYYPDADKTQLVKKFNSLRTNFRKELRRIKNSEKSGAVTDDIIEPTLWYFEEMKFLLRQDEPSTLQNTIQIEDDDKEETEDDIDNFNSSRIMNTISHKNGPPKKKARSLDKSKELKLLASKYLQQPQTDFDKIGLAWAAELQNMTPQQQMFAKKAINDILFEGQMGTLHRNSVQINLFETVTVKSECILSD